MQNSLENIHWKSLCPWLLLADSLRAAFRVRVLVLAFVGVLLVLAVEALLERTIAAPQWNLANEQVNLISQEPLEKRIEREIGEQSGRGLILPWWHLAVPISTTFSESWSFSQTIAALILTLWQVAVWALFGGAICRIAALALTRGEAPDVPHSLKFAKRNYGAFFAAPVGTLIGVCLASVPLVFLGLLMRLDWLSYIAVIFWPLALLIGLGIAFLAIGLALGFALMWAAVAVEETDAFDAVSRAYAYIYQRPLRLLWYVLVAALLGWLGGMAVELVLAATRSMTEGAVAWGLGSDSIPATGRKIIRFWNGGLSILRAAYYYAFFWSAAVGIYLLLRRDIDSVQLDEVTVEPMETYTPSPLVAAGAEAETQPASN